MKLVFQGALWPIPRPRIWRDWEGRKVELGVSVGNGHTDDILYVGIRHDLSDRELGWIDRFILREPPVTVSSTEEFHERYGRAS